MAKKAKKKYDQCCGPWGIVGKRGSDDSGAFGRILFITGILFVLNSLGLLHGIAPWMLALIWLGFVLIRF